MGYLHRDDLFRDGFVAEVGILDECAVFGIVEETVQALYSLCIRTAQVDVLGMERGEDHHFVTRTGYRYIQSTFSTCQVQRTEIHGNLAFLVGTIADGEEDDIAFVALYIFEILNKDWLFTAECPLLDNRILARCLV